MYDSVVHIYRKCYNNVRNYDNEGGKVRGGPKINEEKNSGTYASDSCSYR